jgi:hypothetical protein
LRVYNDVGSQFCFFIGAATAELAAPLPTPQKQQNAFELGRGEEGTLTEY